MKSITTLILMCCTVLLASCAQLSDSQRYEIASDAYVAVTTNVTEASRMGLIGLTELEDYDRIRVPLSAILDRIGDTLESKQGVPSDWWSRLNYLLDAAYTVVDDLNIQKE